ncbi:sensor histidine kinase [Methylobacterium nonmethylotrophicum]|uniref:histidine kinase n=1 Tax=Methylobacterium nonmethylotrophicum TaxID=1141884 RepID=A0A4Z0NN04_9HYPH|nr:ATP-binding protein [Methylobacterium nonmethylotrophicum]TGD97442.1 HAMP domain-containing protein [Methylobacterium nonmethylotrophicum]
MTDLLRSTTFRWALGIALWSVLLALAMFGFVYWQTVSFLREELAETLRLEVRAAAEDPAAASARVETWIAMDRHATHYGGVFGRDGRRLAGNLVGLPAGLARDGDAERVGATIEVSEGSLGDEIWATALALPDGGTVVIGHDTDEIDRVRATTLRAFGLGLVPALALSGLGGLLLASRARRRLAVTEAALAEVMRGDLRRRLPVGSRDDEFDRLARNVNRMLDEVERLMGEVRSVGDAVAHDLRTPLTRLRARLERSREQARSVAEFREAIDQGLAWIDQTLAMVTAVLRIGEIEHGLRRAGFAPVDLTRIVREAAEFFEPVAEDKGVALAVAVDEGAGRSPVEGDRDLLFEAVSNLIDNAVKFTPAGGSVRVGLEQGPAASVIVVEDSGPGIPPAERTRIFQRFYRAERARQTPGNGLGLGLGLVAAIARLHGFPVEAGKAPGGGARLTLVCPVPAPTDPARRRLAVAQAGASAPAGILQPRSGRDPL